LFRYFQEKKLIFRDLYHDTKIPKKLRKEVKFYKFDPCLKVFSRKYIALIYPLSKTLKMFEFKKSRFFNQSWKNRFLLKTKSPNKKRSADLKSAFNSEFNYVLHYIWL
jgi:hypothetical protein